MQPRTTNVRTRDRALALFFLALPLLVPSLALAEDEASGEGILSTAILRFALLGAEWVLWLLVVLSVGVVAITAERAWYLYSDRSDGDKLSEAVNSYLSDGVLGTFRSRLGQIGGLEARILSAGAESADAGSGAAEKAMEGTATAEKLRMERGLSYLATVGANAPFIGLFGTVLGVIQAFNDLKESTEAAKQAVMGSISEALVATAVGLAVAIPAVVLFNMFSRAVKARLSRSESLADLVLARMDGGAADGS